MACAAFRPGREPWADDPRSAGPTDTTKGATMADVKGLSDHALSILAFAAYHRLVSGERVTSVIRKDGAGHEADPKGVEELTGRGLAREGDTEIELGEEAQEAVETLVAAMRSTLG